MRFSGNKFRVERVRRAKVPRAAGAFQHLPDLQALDVNFSNTGGTRYKKLRCRPTQSFKETSDGNGTRNASLAPWSADTNHHSSDAFLALKFAQVHGNLSVGY